MSNPNLNIDPTTTKYLIRASISADGVIEKPDVVGAIFGQTEGLLGEELDLRDLQKSGRIGRIEVIIDSKKGKSTGDIHLPSSLDKVETAILAAALESIDRVGPAKAEIKVTGIEDVRSVKREAVISRARELLARLGEAGKGDSESIMEMVRDSIRVEDMVSYGPERLPAGPNVSKSDSIIVVEGRNDVANLLRHGIKNAIAVEGTNVPKAIIDLCKEKSAIAFVDGDRGGELILKELLQVAEIDFIARAPRANEVEELTQKQLIKALRNKIPAEQFVELYSLEKGGGGHARDNPRGRDAGRGDRRGGRPQQAMVEDEDDDEDVDLSTPIEGVDMTPAPATRRPEPRREEPRREEREDRRGRDDRRPGREDRREERREVREDRREPREERREERREPRGEREDRREPREPREERAERPPREERREERMERPPREDREERRERRPREERAERPRAPEPAEAEAAEDEGAPAGGPRGEREAKFLAHLEELSGKLQAVLLNEQLERVGDKVAVRDLADTLKKDVPGVTAVVFDGVVTQRLIDIALDKKIGTLVGVKTGNITKKPAGVEVVTRADLA